MANPGPFSVLEPELEERRTASLLRRRRTWSGACGPHAVFDGREVLSFASNDYLGLAAHPALAQALTTGAQAYGVGAGASHLVSGHTAAHDQLETQLAEFVEAESALLFSTGYMANLGVVSALLGRDDELFADRLNHASLNDAGVLSRAQFTRYAHGDLDMLERQLAASRARRKLVVTDAVFSMDGDIAPIPDLLALCERHDAWLMVDDAHGFGVLGPSGRGSLEHFGLRPDRLIYMATLGKAAGVFGAFVAGPAVLIETLVQRARTYIYTTAMPAPLATALSESLRLIGAGRERREHLGRLAQRLRSRLHLARWQLMASSTPIQPLVIGDNAETLRVAEGLLQRGIHVPAIRPPTVPQGTARLRISLSAAHRSEDVDRLADALLTLEQA